MKKEPKMKSISIARLKLVDADRRGVDVVGT